MNNIIINLDGISTEIKRFKIPLNQLILDIDNPRIQYFLDIFLIYIFKFTRFLGRISYEMMQTIRAVIIIFAGYLTIDRNLIIQIMPVI